MSKNIFITATNTDVGKTYVSALILKKMNELALNCGYYKPVLSGVKVLDNKLKESDCNFVIKTAKLKLVPEDCVSYYWEEAVSPHLASKINNTKIQKQKFLKDFQTHSNEHDYLLIEGAGGITCPIILNTNEQYLLKDLIKDLSLDIIIIADSQLGTINSTLLTVEYAKQHEINIKGIILNNFDKENFVHQDNLEQIEKLTQVKVIATVSKNQTELEDLSCYFS